MPTAEELLGESLDVPVHAALVGPGIWRDETDAHELLRVGHGKRVRARRRPSPSRTHDRRVLCTQATADADARRSSRLGPGEAGEDEEIGGADLQQEGAGVVGEGADDGRGEGAEQAGPHRRHVADPGAQALAARGRRGRRGSPPPAGRRAGPGGRSCGPRAGAGAGRRRRGRRGRRRRGPSGSGGRWRRRPGRSSASRASTAKGVATTASRPRRRSRPAIASAATAAPIGKTIAAPTSAPKRPAAKTKAASRPTTRKTAAARRRSRPGRKPASAGAGAGDDEHGQQRLELVADPVEADAEAGVGAEQRERGQRRAGDQVDRVGEHGQRRRRRRARGSRAAPPASAPPAAAPRASTSSTSAPCVGSSAAAPSRTRAAGRRRRARRPGPPAGPAPRCSGPARARAARIQASRLSPITGPRRWEITAIRAPSDAIAATSTEPSLRIGCPDISDGTSRPK